MYDDDDDVFLKRTKAESEEVRETLVYVVTILEKKKG